MVILRTFIIGLSMLAGIGTTYAQDVSVSLSASKQIVEVEEIFSYTITVRNRGESRDDIELRLVLDNELELEAASDGGRGRSTVTWSDQSFTAGQTRKFTATVIVDDGAEDEHTLRTTAFVGGEIATAEGTVINEDDVNNDDERNISVRISSSTKNVKPDGTFTYNIELSNRNRKRANGVNVQLRLPKEIEVLSASNQGSDSSSGVEWSDLSIDGNETRNLTVSARVADDAVDGDVLEATLVTEGTVDEYELYVFDPYEGAENMRVSVFSNADEIMAGDDITYEVRITNSAPQDERINVRAFFDPKTTFASADNDGKQFDKTFIKWEDVFVEQSDTIDLSFTVTAKESAVGQVLARVEAGIGQATEQLYVQAKPVEEPEEEENEEEEEPRSRGGFFGRGDEQQEEPEQAVNPDVGLDQLTLEKTVNARDAQPGSYLTYAIMVTNTGTMPVTDIVVIDAFPIGKLEINEVPEGGVLTDNTITWELDELAPRQTWRVTYQARTSQQARHGEVLATSATVQKKDGNRRKESAAQTNVITALPQAGFGPISTAFAASKGQLRAVQTAKAAGNSTTRESTTSLPWYGWILIGGAGVGAGVVIKRKLTNY